MSNDFDLIIRRARLRGRGERLFDLGVRAGRLAAIEEHLTGGAEVELDAAGGLTTESFVNPHLHLCKVYTLQMMDEEALRDYHGADMGKAMTAIELAARVKEKYDESWIIVNVRRARWCSRKDGHRNSIPLNNSIVTSIQGSIMPRPRTAWFITSWA